jgi:hypothetical protein
MKQENIDTLNKLYDSLKLLCYQFPVFISDFDIGFIKKSETEKLVFDRVHTKLKNCMTDVFYTSEIVFNIINSDDETELNSLLESLDVDGGHNG